MNMGFKDHMRYTPEEAARAAQSKSLDLGYIWTEHDAICALVEAIERIETSWASNNLAEAVRQAVAIKNELCQVFDVLPGVD